MTRELASRRGPQRRHVSGSKLAVLRFDRKLTQTTLAQRIGLSQSYISMWEESDVVPDRYVDRLAAALGMDREALEQELYGVVELPQGLRRPA